MPPLSLGLFASLTGLGTEPSEEAGIGFFLLIETGDLFLKENLIELEDDSGSLLAEDASVLIQEDARLYL